MNWFKISGRGDKRKRSHKKKTPFWQTREQLEQSKKKEQEKPKEKAPIVTPRKARQFPKDMNVRDVYRLKDDAYRQWAAQNEDRKHFLVTPFIDNIMKVHRPGKLTHRRSNVPIKEIERWCEEAQKQNVTHAFVLMPEHDLNEYYGWYDKKGNLIDSGKDTLFDAYAEHGIQVHHVPIRDFGTPRMSDMIESCKELKQANDQAAAKGERVVVHCSAGIGRTGLLTSCYLVYTNRLSAQELAELQQNAMKSESKGFYFDKGKPQKRDLNEMQKKVWYDVTSQLDFIADFADLKERVEDEGKSLGSPEVIKQVREYDIKREKEEKKKREAFEREQRKRELEELSAPQKFTKPTGGIDEAWARYMGQEEEEGAGEIVEDDVEVIDDQEWVRGADGNWYAVEDMPNIYDPDNPRMNDPDMPPEDYAPLWSKKYNPRERSELKRRTKKRPYLKDKMELAEDEWDEQLGNEELEKIDVEPMTDEEWLKRFGEAFGFEKNAEEEKKQDDLFYSKQLHQIPLRPKIESVSPGLYKGKRPGYGNRQQSDAQLIEDYAKVMKDAGITDIFLLLNEKELNKYYGGDALLSIYEKYFDVHHHPIKDFSVPEMEEALAFAIDLDQTIKGGGQAIVHCSAGIGRTGMMLSVYDIYKGEKPKYRGQTALQSRFIDEFAKWLEAQRNQ